ncbi:uncharacterized protein PG986_009704 [Apiospora aurea]|uniref:Uncharacterized protein n=1 Tax=Apiospora aurea TaxID=335848 RepID=A0ABR1Q8I9_9PEZI
MCLGEPLPDWARKEPPAERGDIHNVDILYFDYVMGDQLPHTGSEEKAVDGEAMKADEARLAGEGAESVEMRTDTARMQAEDKKRAEKLEALRRGGEELLRWAREDFARYGMATDLGGANQNA